MIAATAMALSSLAVVGNANRLRGYRPPPVAAGHTARTVAAPKVEVRTPELRQAEAMATVKDPVCGMDIAANSAVAREEYHGKTYHFCSAACHDKFKAMPQKYVS